MGERGLEPGLCSQFDDRKMLILCSQIDTWGKKQLFGAAVSPVLAMGCEDRPGRPHRASLYSHLGRVEFFTL